MAALGGLVATFILCGTEAEARIVCHDGFQVVNGQEISTPYCNDNYVAEVARQHGVKVANEAVRNNPSLKSQICRFVGSDVRIENYCEGDRGSDKVR
jgi:hypothetical protein